MFEIGKWYTLTTQESSVRTVSSGWLASKVQWPMVEFIDMGGNARLINVASSSFIEAKLSENQSGKRPVLALPNWVRHDGQAN